MKELTGDIWSFHKKGYTIAITTNGTLNSYGQLVMGKGLAAQAKGRYPELPQALGNVVGSTAGGNIVHYLKGYRLFTFPTKHDWFNQNSDLELIKRSAKELKEKMGRHKEELLRGGVILPRPGCGLRGLLWVEMVRPALDEIFGNDTKICIVNNT